MSLIDEQLSVAPMVEITDAHFRYFLRGLTKKTVLYTEMIVDDNILSHQPNLDFLVGKSIEENPSVIQLGGHNAETLARAAELCSQYGDYSEINLNCGCPSQRVSQRCFGAKLMEEPEYVREIVHQMQRRCPDKPITVKCRIGVDNKDSYDELCHFIKETHLGGANKYIIHSRKCFLSGLSTKQNREIPPLKYDIVHRLAYDFPDLKFILNGGIMNFKQAKSHFSSPWILDTTSIDLTSTVDVITNKRNKKKIKINHTENYINSIPSTSSVTETISIVQDYCISNNITNELSQIIYNQNTSLLTAAAAATAINNTMNSNFDNYKSTHENTVTVNNSETTVKYAPVHGVMIGRAFHATPLMLSTADEEFFNTPNIQITRRDLLERYIKYCEFIQSDSGPKNFSIVKNKSYLAATSILLKPVHSVMNGLFNSPLYKRLLNDVYVARVHKGVANPSCREVIEGAMECISDSDLDKIISPITTSNTIKI